MGTIDKAGIVVESFFLDNLLMLCYASKWHYPRTATLCQCVPSAVFVLKLSKVWLMWSGLVICLGWTLISVRSAIAYFVVTDIYATTLTDCHRVTASTQPPSSKELAEAASALYTMRNSNAMRSRRLDFSPYISHTSLSLESILDGRQTSWRSWFPAPTSGKITWSPRCPRIDSYHL